MNIDTKHSGEPDSLDQLGLLLYGRSPMPREWVGGPDAKFIHDAAHRIAELEAKLEAKDAEIARLRAKLDAVRAVPCYLDDYGGAINLDDDGTWMLAEDVFAALADQ